MFLFISFNLFVIILGCHLSCPAGLRSDSFQRSGDIKNREASILKLLYF